MKTTWICCLLTLIVAFCLPETASAQQTADSEGFVSLFNGRSLEGWHGNTDMWTVEDGAIVGRTDGKIPHNTFLIHERACSDFVLKAAFKLHNHKGNSGIQFRSEERKDFAVAGYQADIASNKFMGILYSEGTGRGILAQVSPETQTVLADAIKKDGWNEYTITAQGDHIILELNGVKTVDLKDDDAKGAKSGIFALQLHKGHDMAISFKDIRLKELTRAD